MYWPNQLIITVLYNRRCRFSNNRAIHNSIVRINPIINGRSPNFKAVVPEPSNFNSRACITRNQLFRQFQLIDPVKTIFRIIRINRQSPRSFVWTIPINRNHQTSIVREIPNDRQSTRSFTRTISIKAPDINCSGVSNGQSLNSIVRTSSINRETPESFICPDNFNCSNNSNQ